VPCCLFSKGCYCTTVISVNMAYDVPFINIVSSGTVGLESRFILTGCNYCLAVFYAFKIVIRGMTQSIRIINVLDP